MALGVNIHSKDQASITPYKWHDTWSTEKGYKHMDMYDRKTQKRFEDNWMWVKGVDDQGMRDLQLIRSARVKKKAVAKSKEKEGQ